MQKTIMQNLWDRKTEECFFFLALQIRMVIRTPPYHRPVVASLSHACNWYISKNRGRVSKTKAQSWKSDATVNAQSGTNTATIFKGDIAISGQCWHRFLHFQEGRATKTALRRNFCIHFFSSNPLFLVLFLLIYWYLTASSRSSSPPSHYKHCWCWQENTFCCGLKNIFVLFPIQIGDLNIAPQEYIWVRRGRPREKVWAYCVHLWVELWWAVHRKDEKWRELCVCSFPGGISIPRVLYS